MKKITLLVVFLSSLAGYSQANKQKIQAYYDSKLSQYALTSQDVSDLYLRNEVIGNGTKITSCYVIQRYQGTEIFNSLSNVAIKDGQILKAGTNFVSNLAQKVNAVTPTLSATDAAASAYTKLGINVAANFAVVETRTNKSYKLTDGIQEDQISATLVYQPTADDKLMLAWDLEFYAPNSSNLWSLRVDALNGKILEKRNMTLSCNFGDGHNHGSHEFSFVKNAFNAPTSILETQGGSYRVIPFNYESPNHSPFQLITNPEYAASSPNGWHNSSTTIGGMTPTAMYTFTRGNNILAQEDADGNNGNGLRAEGGATLNFDFTYGGESAQPTSYTNAATTNLFYMGNVIHDIWYQYGFNEASGNFQQANYGLGGVQSGTGDYILGDAQDGYSQTTPTLNNANFSSPTDGARPRVQMFLWNAGSPPTEFITITSPASIAGTRVATSNVFEGTDSIPVPVAPNGVAAQLVHYTNPANAPGNNPITIHNGCVPPTNPFDISGKIALIRRGNCNFSNKVKNAQDAGALAVIVYDTVPNNPVRLSMSSEGLLGINIPAVFVTKEIGEEMAIAMQTETVNVKIEVPSNLYLYADGDFDNVIIGHEIGHGISNRLIAGGGANCMNNYEQMGEGWSDWFGLTLQLKAGDNGVDAKTIGTYTFNEDPQFGAGLREFPYSTDMTINPRTYADSNAPIPLDPADTGYRYVVGEFWASVMWDLSWGFINQYGFDPNVYSGNGGNNMIMQLTIDALKLEVCNQSSCVSSRDALFAADQAMNGGANYNMMAEIFRRRGLGLNASAGSANNSNDQVEDFTAFPLATKGFVNNALVRVYPNPSNGTFNVRIPQYAGKVALQVVDLNGRVVYSQSDDNFNVEKTVNLGGLQTGVYVLKVNTSEFNFTDKIIIR